MIRAKKLNPAKLNLTIAVLLSMVLIPTLLTSCDLLNRLSGASSQQAAPGQSGQAGNAAVNSQAINPQLKKIFDGTWKLAFSINDQVQSSHIDLVLSGDKIAGKGKDDHNGKAFLVENGHLQGEEVVFYKRYENPDNPNQPPVEYMGKLHLQDHPPYMAGEYSVALGGKEINGPWEAEKIDGAAGSSQSQAQAPPPPKPEHKVQKPAKAPDLSGKWDLAFEYDFKTIQSSMFLEQLGTNVSGHGLDLTTNEKFEVEKGWYYYPKVTLVRKYPAVKQNNKIVKPERRMTFKAEISWVDEHDYQGPYMSGKTDGGGNWEAQLVR